MIEVLRSGPALARPARPRVRAGVRRARSARPHASAVSSGTAGLHLALRAVGRRGRRRGHHLAVLVRRLGERRSSTSARSRSSSTSTPTRCASTRRPPRPRSPSARARCCRCTSSAGPPTRPRSRRSACRSSRTPARRSARVHADGTAVGSRGHPAVFAFYAEQADDHRRGRHGRHRRRRPQGAHRLRAQPGPRAGHGLARPRPARLQLPPDRHRQRDRARPARAPRRACSPDRARVAGLYREALARPAGSTLPCEDPAAARRGWFVFVVQLPRRRRPRRRRSSRCAMSACSPSPTCPPST